KPGTKSALISHPVGLPLCCYSTSCLTPLPTSVLIPVDLLVDKLFSTFFRKRERSDCGDGEGSCKHQEDHERALSSGQERHNQGGNDRGDATESGCGSRACTAQSRGVQFRP